VSNHSNARPHVSKSFNNVTSHGPSEKTVSNALKRRAQAVINDKTIDAETRALIRYGLEKTIHHSLNWSVEQMRVKT